MRLQRKIKCNRISEKNRQLNKPFESSLWMKIWKISLILIIQFLRISSTIRNWGTFIFVQWFSYFCTQFILRCETFFEIGPLCIKMTQNHYNWPTFRSRAPSLTTPYLVIEADRAKKSGFSSFYNPWLWVFGSQPFIVVSFYDNTHSQTFFPIWRKVPLRVTVATVE